MKKLIVLALLLFGGYRLYQGGGLDSLPFMRQAGAFDGNGKPMVRLFVGPNCAAPCNEVEEMLQARHVDYQLVDIATPDGEKYGVRQYPLTQVGKDRVLGNDVHQIVAVLAGNLGKAVLTRPERMAMANHFDDGGQPIVAMYGTDWCPYCKRQREYFASNGIPFQEFNPEKSDAAKTAYDILQGRGYPLTYVGYRRFDGYKGEEIKEALAAR